MRGAISIPATRGSVNEKYRRMLWSDRKFCLDNNTQLYLMSVPTERIVQTCIEIQKLESWDDFRTVTGIASPVLAGNTTAGFEFASELKQRGQGGSKQWQLEK